MLRTVRAFLPVVQLRLPASKRFLTSLRIALIASLLPSIHLAVLSTPQPPSAAANHPIIYLAMSMKGRINCPLESDPPSTSIQGVKDGRPVEFNSTGRVRVSADGHLLIKTVLVSDEGEYSCVAYSPLRPRIESPTVQVLVRDVPHFVLTPRPIYQRQQMQTVSLPCMSDANPQPKITWRKINGSFPSSTRTMQDGGNLTIARLTRDDHGVYECIATNPVATISTTTFLLIETTSFHGPHLLSVATTHHSATISWHPGFDEGFPVHQLLWYRRLDDGPTLNNRVNASTFQIWKTIEVVPNDTATLTLHNLRENSSYEFYIQARLHRTGQVLTSDVITAQTKNKPAKSSGSSNSVSTRSHSVTDRALGDRSNAPLLLTPGQLPHRPVNVTVHQQPDGLLISWHHPPLSPASVVFYEVEYRTVGQWVPLATRTVDKPWYLWKTVSRGVTYQFRVISGGHSSRLSEPSPAVTFLSTSGGGRPANSALVYGVVGVAVAIVLAGTGSAALVLLSLRNVVLKRRRRKQEAAKYGNVKFSEHNHNSDGLDPAQRGKESVATDRRDSLMTSVMDDVVGMLTYDVYKDKDDSTNGRRIHLEETV